MLILKYKFNMSVFNSPLHPLPPVSLLEIRGHVRWSTCGSQAKIAMFS